MGRAGPDDAPRARIHGLLAVLLVTSGLLLNVYLLGLALTADGRLDDPRTWIVLLALDAVALGAGAWLWLHRHAPSWRRLGFAAGLVLLPLILLPLSFLKVVDPRLGLAGFPAGATERNPGEVGLITSTDCSAEPAVTTSQLCREKSASPQSYWIAEATGGAGAATWVELTRADSLSNDHGGLGGRADDDHTQYSTYALAIRHWMDGGSISDLQCIQWIGASSGAAPSACGSARAPYVASFPQTVELLAVSITTGPGDDFSRNEECWFNLRVSTDAGSSFYDQGTLIKASDGSGADLGATGTTTHVAVGQSLSPTDRLRIRTEEPTGGSETCTGASCRCEDVSAGMHWQMYVRPAGAGR